MGACVDGRPERVMEVLARTKAGYLWVDINFFSPSFLFLDLPNT